MTTNPELTTLLRAWQQGDAIARNELFSHVNENMLAIANNLLRGDRQQGVIQPQELVNECVIRMFGLSRLEWRDRAHFIGVASGTMRRVLVDEARRLDTQMRDAIEVTLNTSVLGLAEKSASIQELDASLELLTKVSPELQRVVELKYFGGLTNDEVAIVMDLSKSTVKRYWRTARAWLFDEMKSTRSNGA